MVKYEKRNNVIVGSVMYALMLLNCIIASVSYIPTIARGYATPYTVCYLIECIIMMFVISAALVIMLIRKRQSGFGVALPMAESLFSQIAFFIALLIQNASTYYRAHPNWTTYLTFLIIIPIMLVIIYFFVPNLVMKIISACAVGIAFITRMILTFTEIFNSVNHGFFRGMYAFSVILGLTMAFLLYSLIIVQIFMSFKKSNGPVVNAYPAASYAPVPQPAAPVQPKVIPNEQIMANYQNLLEKGLINQEQFDEKKKELFGE